MTRPDAPSSRQGLLLVGTAIVLTGLNLRTAVNSVGPVLQELQAGLGISSGLTGLVTSLPLICFAAIGFAGPPLAARFRDGHVLAGALLTMAAGLVVRAVAGAFWQFVAGTVLAMVGGALGNVLLPSLVKKWFPARTGLLVGAYGTAMAAGGAVASVSAAPIAHAAGDAGWRWALAVWAVPALLAALPWLAVRPRPGTSRTAHTAVSLRALARSPTAVALAAFFGLQAMEAYIVIGWTAQYLRDSGLDAATAGLLLGVNTVVVVPLNAVVPPLSVRPQLQRPLLLVFAACYVGGWLGLLLAPRTVPWLWMSLLALGMSTFAMVLALIGLRARTPQSTAVLSTAVQGWGYVLAGTGPLLVGVLLGATGSYAGMFAVAFTGVAALLAAGWLATRERFVDDEVAARAEPPVREPNAASPRG